MNQTSDTAARIRSWVGDYLEPLGLPASANSLMAQVVPAVLVLLVAVAANFVAKRVLLAGIQRVALRSRTQWDDLLVEHGVFLKLARLAPAAVVHVSARLFPPFQAGIENIALAYMAAVALATVGALLDAGGSIYRTMEGAEKKPIRGYVQAVKLFLYAVGGIVILATLLGESPWKLLSGIGALTAVLLLVFKDSILGFVASVQITSNDLVRIGDWIEMPKYGADGDVTDVTLTSVKVRNWDKTVSTIPTYALIADSFKNWRGMTEAGGRRIKRSVNIDINSVRFCDEKMLDRFEKFAGLKDYIRSRRDELKEYNAGLDLDLEIPVNGRRLTNLGTFRAYLRKYLANHPKIRRDMTALVRQLAPGPNGIPIELYVFSSDTRWAHYEELQGDIFDHVLAVLPEFGLRVFQEPTGSDFRALAVRARNESAGGS